MGSSSWSDDFYTHRETERKNAGTDAFEYHRDVSTGKAAREVHAKMNPKEVVRESRDSTEHPESNAIFVAFDVTGSMHDVPRVLQQKLPKLNGLLTNEEYISHPQVLMAAVGDQTCDAASLQCGQFESGIEQDDDLGRMYLEGGGGGSNQESYQNVIYFAARHTVLDCHEKRKRKGYLFLMGDEHPYDRVNKDEINAVMGDSLQDHIPTEDIVKEAQEKYHVFFIIPEGTAHAREPALLAKWSGLLGADHVIQLADPGAVCEVIATVVGLTEGTIDLEKAKANLVAEQTEAATVELVAAAVAHIVGGSNGSSGASPRNVRL